MQYDASRSNGGSMLLYRTLWGWGCHANSDKLRLCLALYKEASPPMPICKLAVRVSRAHAFAAAELFCSAITSRFLPARSCVAVRQSEARVAPPPSHEQGAGKP